MKKSINNKIDSLRSSWYVWFFPLVALAISVWLFMSFFNQKGPEILITFDDAAGIEAEKTQIRFRGVVVGTVKEVTISPDNKDVVARAILHKDATHLAVQGSKYWVVVPKVNFQGISGLETLIEGTYIAVLPGSPNAKIQNEFRGQIGRDTNESLEDTSAYVLEADRVDSLSPGDVVSFRGLKVGTVSKVNLSKSAQTILIEINIENKYTRLVRENTLFWRKVGVQANLGLFKSEVKIESLESLMRGGIDLFTPEPAGPKAKAFTRFALHKSPPEGWEKWNPDLEIKP